MDANNLSILLIEDNPGDARLIRELLTEAKSASFNLQVADRLSTALERLTQDTIDAILLDLSLPDSQGVDTLVRLRTRAPRVPIVVLTGQEDETLGLELVQNGAQDYMVKGQVISSLLTRTLRYAIERKRAEATERAQRDRTEALVRTAARLNAQLDLDTLVNVVCEETVRAMNVPAASITLYDDQRNVLDLAATFGLPPEYRQDHQPIPRAIYDHYFQQMGSLIVVPDVQAEPGLADAPLYARHDIRTIATASLLRDDQLVGGLNVYSLGKPYAFSEDELALFRGLADQAAQAIANARLFEQAEKRVDQLGTLYDAGLALNRVLDQSVQLQFLLKLAMRALQADRAEFFDYDAASNAMRFKLGLGYGEAEQQAMLERIFPIGKQGSLVGWVAENKVHLSVPDVSLDSRWVPIDPEIRSAVLAPIQHEQELRGVLGVSSTRVSAFTMQDERLLVLFANQVSVAIENARLFQETRRQVQHLNALREIDVAITGSMDLRIMLQVILEKARAQLHIDAADVLLLNSHQQTLEYAMGVGFRTTAFQYTRLQMGDGYAGRAALERRAIHVPDLVKDPNGLARAPLLGQEGFAAYHAVPLVSKGQVKGVLELFHRSRLSTSTEWLDFLESLAGQAAIAIDNAALFEGLQRSNMELSAAYDTTLEGWSRALDLRDRETEGHTQRVTELTLRLARRMGVREELVNIRRGAVLHDIGKMGVPDAILFKPAELTEEEWAVMRMHPQFAYDLLAPIAYLRPALDIPYCHHEKWDGTGYPRGLKGEQIPFSARIFAIVDVWDALRSNRPYRSAWPDEQALEHIKSLSGTHFDPKVVENFLQMIDEDVDV